MTSGVSVGRTSSSIKLQSRAVIGHNGAMQ